MLSTGSIGGTLLGPIIGGYLTEIIGIRKNFLVMGILLLITFILTLLFVHEDFVPPKGKLEPFSQIWISLTNKTLLIGMFITTFIVQFALFSVQPVITVYINVLMPDTQHLAFCRVWYLQ